jgi:RNA polymerase sigma factor (sigma-70 family)
MADSVAPAAPLPSGDQSGAVVPIALPALEKPALAALFEIEESALLAFALGLVARRAIAEELVQDAFLRLHEIWDQIENPRAWLYRSVRNLALNHLRDHQRETAWRETGKAGDDTPPDETLGRMEAIGMVRMFLAEMAPEDRDLIRLKYHDDLKYHEISARTGISVGNVGYKLHHLLKGLADALRHAGVEGSRG